jgi:uncharacterized protein
LKKSLRGSGPARSRLPPATGRGELASRVAIVDSGALYAAIDLDDANHGPCARVLREPGLRLVIPALVVAEVTYLVGTRLGPPTEARFLMSLAEYEVRGPEPDDWERISALVAKYRNLPLGGTDASVIVLADRLRTSLIITTDLRDFGAVRDAAGHPFQLLPEKHV